MRLQPIIFRTPGQLFTKHIQPICFVFTFSLLLSIGASSQQSNDWRTNIDLIVERTDSLSLKSQRTFYLNRIVKVDRTYKNDKAIRETWNYTVHNGKVILFQVHYVIDSSEFLEVYYVNNNRLICMEQYESLYFSSSDEVKWGEVLFFRDNSLKLYVKVGKPKPEQAYAKAGTKAFETFDKRFIELQNNLR
ncbi:MAG: hypothetical protein WKF89_01860 [Chitinophagaceae bacterium]